MHIFIDYLYLDVYIYIFSIRCEDVCAWSGNIFQLCLQQIWLHCHLRVHTWGHFLNLFSFHAKFECVLICRWFGFIWGSVPDPLDSLLSELSGSSECSKLQSRLLYLILCEKENTLTWCMTFPAKVLVLFEESGGGPHERHLLHPLPPAPPLPLHLHLCSPRHAGLCHYC